MAFLLAQSIALCFAATALGSPIGPRSVPDFVFPGDAPFSVDAATLAAALTCPNGNPTASAPPVLLVHGTTSTGAETWGAGYVPALAANGYTACYVTLPGRAMGDMQVSAEYVAYNLHYTSYLAGGLKTAVISHSQGGPDTQWALQFWPSTNAVTTSFIPLSPDFAGIQFLDSNLSSLCQGNSLCQASLWQQSAGSHFLGALHSHGFTAKVPTTSIWSESDGVVTPPQQNAQLPAATVISVQQLCPLRYVNHVYMPTDAAAFAIAMDALRHGGTADLSRVQTNSWTACFMIEAPNMSSTIAIQLQDDLNSLIDGFLLGSPRVAAEPPLMAYAQ